MTKWVAAVGMASARQGVSGGLLAEQHEALLGIDDRAVNGSPLHRRRFARSEERTVCALAGKARLSILRAFRADPRRPCR